jgi:hypothetical protein
LKSSGKLIMMSVRAKEVKVVCLHFYSMIVPQSGVFPMCCQLSKDHHRAEGPYGAIATLFRVTNALSNDSHTVVVGRLVKVSVQLDLVGVAVFRTARRVLLSK